MERMIVWMGVSLVAIGLLVTGLGLWLSAAGKTGGRLLPGDIVVQRPGFTLVFPVATCLLLSAALTVVLWIVALLRR